MIAIKTVSPIKELKDALDQNMKPKVLDVKPLELAESPIKAMSAAMPSALMQPSHGDSDKEMVLNRLRSINRMSEILERMACGCEPMPSWAEAKIYSAAKDLQGVLGYLLGK